MSGVVAALAGSASGPQLVADLGLDASYAASDAGGAPLACGMTFTVKRDGTWTMTIGGDDVWDVGTTFAGEWADPPSATVGDGFELTITTDATNNTPTISNEAALRVAITEDRTYLVSKSGGTAWADMTALFRKIGGSDSPLGSTRMQVTGG